MANPSFPLEPLRSVRDIRLRAVEAELKRCRELHVQAEQQRELAQAELERARSDRENFAVRSWRELFDDGVPTALAMSRYEHHLALLDHGIVDRGFTVGERERDCAQAAAALDAAGVVWRRARRKLDAVGELKQGWLRDARNGAERREEQSLEELLLRQAAR